MSKKKSFLVRATAGAAGLLLGGVAQAAIVPVEQTLTLVNPTGSTVYNIGTNGGAASTVSYYQLVVDPTWTVPTKFTTFATEPIGTTASYEIFVDTDASLVASNTGASLTNFTQTDIPFDNSSPFYTYLLGAGQYVLQLTTLPGQFSISTQISAVPLPGAMWLFGSGLLAFLAMTKRRKL